MKGRMELIGGEVPQFDEAAFYKIVDNFLDETAQAMQADYYVTVRTWKHQVDFIINNYGRTGRDIFTWDDIYLFVTEGTRVRYVTMTPDFSPKSSPGIIRSVQGRGGVAYFSKQHPRPGIEARNFHKAINSKWEPMFPAQWNRAVDAAPSSLWI